MQLGGALVLHWCATCADVRAFEAPPCQEGHGSCPELACLDCGSAVLVGVLADPSAGTHREVTRAADAAWTLPRSA